jgi:hypothetical protein
MRFIKHLWLLPVGLFLVNQVVQVSLVINRDLSSWVGGGYGMFANLDQPLTRRISVEIFNDESGWRKFKVQENSQRLELEDYKSHMNDDLLKITLKNISLKSRAHIYAPYALMAN